MVRTDTWEEFNEVRDEPPLHRKLEMHLENTIAHMKLEWNAKNADHLRRKIDLMTASLGGELW
eukprot:CAMPEP_0114323344 /NCGR_PEP_ID=MMETSP0059-20121206/27807_1 /TAXON_ID=36894 /ORGANISM="Pyramimonas parkeae, Strain CCMP726" /LENGTH=62 /DNA_ID=CAMNT_0001451577 /DNA_START=272 /DNA_END=457 /DNA_ORIENTATION=-